MARKKEFSVKGKINPDGKGLTFFHAETLSHIFQPLSEQECDITIVFGKVKRSIQQNRYLWGVAYPVVQREMMRLYGEAMDPNAIHAHNLQIIQGCTLEFVTIHGRQLLEIKDTKSSEMSVEEFTIMVDNLKQWYAINKHIVIPDPVEDNALNHFVIS